MELEIFDFAMIGWILGTLWTLLFPFYLKIKKGELTLADFNYGYLVNFFTTLAIGIFVSMFVFTTWAIPVESGWMVFVISLLTAAGMDDTILKEFFKWVGLYKKLENRRASYEPTVDNSID